MEFLRGVLERRKESQLREWVKKRWGRKKKNARGGEMKKKKKNQNTPPGAVDGEEAHRLFRGPGGGQEGL